MNVLKRYFIFLFLSQLVFSQKNEFGKDYYLVGLLSEDIGKWKTNKSSDIVEQFDINEQLILDKIICIYKVEKPFVTKTDYEQFILHSKNLQNDVDKFYNWTFDDGVSNENNDLFYSGSLKTELIKTNSQKLSFLVGVIDRFGFIENQQIELKIICSSLKFNLIKEIILGENCKIVKEVFYKDNLPSSYNLVFIPSKNIIEMLKFTDCK
ncbi:MAG: hypothetical protein V4572_07130 [Bacteroidota bacterium]